MNDFITVTGTVGTPPKHIVTASGLPITNFRLASNQGRFDKAESRWIDGETNWYSVAAFSRLAVNIAASLQQGDRVIVTGKLRIKAWDNGTRAGLDVQIDADSIGHDLTFGTTRFAKTGGARSNGQAAEPAEGAEGAEGPEVPEEFADVSEPEGTGLRLVSDGAVVTPF